MDLQTILKFQGYYYLITAVWSLVHIKSFEAISGPKKEHWLVYTVAVLLIGSSLVFLCSAYGEQRIPKESLLLSVSNCLGLILIDVIFVGRKIIRKVYLGDAFIQLMILIGVVYLHSSS